MSAEQARRLSTLGSCQSGESQLDADLPSDLGSDLASDASDVSDDFLSQFVGQDGRPFKEANIELWCEQVLFNSAQQSAVDRELQNDFIDELYQYRTTTDQLSTSDDSLCNSLPDRLPSSLPDSLSDGAFAGQPQATNRSTRDDEVPAAIHTDDLAASPAKRQRKIANEFYGYEDHDYLKPPAEYLLNSTNAFSPRIDRPLNSIDEFMQLNAFQSSNLDLYVNAV